MKKVNQTTQKLWMILGLLALAAFMTACSSSSNDGPLYSSDRENESETATEAETDTESETDTDTEAVSSVGTIVFGTGSFDEEIFNETTTFVQSDDILLQAELPDALGTTEITYILLQLNGSEEIYETWTQNVDPTWDTLFGVYHEPLIDGELEVGNYKLRMFRNDSELIAEGNFSVE
ncbi:hypothetical protein OEV98_06025 [Caldibacillus lycopersici]|uniref:Uncharacterized protein n=1 Tax=Perspicuibacillus lycopersici TaxID=1325689 RepID=A0AAE3LMT4_9BACI|nr:hypothetical protein [Perspicuibacillus lycopersici]MCU9613107.1 hypothetical protein [Perspicuibacillus lycopersici]